MVASFRVRTHRGQRLSPLSLTKRGTTTFGSLPSGFFWFMSLILMDVLPFCLEGGVRTSSAIPETRDLEAPRCHPHHNSLKPVIQDLRPLSLSVSPITTEGRSSWNFRHPGSFPRRLPCQNPPPLSRLFETSSKGLPVAFRPSEYERTNPRGFSWRTSSFPLTRDFFSLPPLTVRLEFLP